MIILIKMYKAYSRTNNSKPRAKEKAVLKVVNKLRTVKLATAEMYAYLKSNYSNLTLSGFQNKDFGKVVKQIKKDGLEKFTQLNKRFVSTMLNKKTKPAQNWMGGVYLVIKNSTFAA